MKVSKRSVPLDMLSFEQLGFKVAICTHRSELIVDIQKNGVTLFNEWMTVDKFVSVFTPKEGAR